ncbi:MAG: peptidylprolyl isomerase, partial [Pseudomonadota bacterium]|nr:peptidylprolyl isomerase [Pseudomonadota bacterium]
LRAQTLRSMVLSPVAQQIKVPAFVTQATYNARYGQREIEYATVKYSDFNVATPTDDQLELYYQQNPQTVPETRAVSYVFVETDMAQPDKYDAGYATAIKIEDDIIAGETMQDAAKKHGAKYVAINAFAQTEKPADKQLTDIMIAKIFDMDEGLESEMIETKDGFLFLRVDKINPSHTAEFATVKNSLISDWKKSEQKKQAYVRANELLVDLNQDGTLQGEKTATVSRTSGAPVEVLAAAFRNNTEQNTIVPGADAFYVLSVTRSIAPALDTKKMADLQNEMQSTMDKSIADDYDSYLKREYPIEINEKIYNRVFGN